MLVLLLIIYGVDALDERNGEVQLTALDGRFLNLTEAGLHAGITSRDNGHRPEQQESHKDDSKQGKHTMLPVPPPASSRTHRER